MRCTGTLENEFDSENGFAVVVVKDVYETVGFMR